jgi:protein-disulfide isomerase
MCVVTYVAVAALFIVSGARTLYPMITIPRRLLQDAKAALASPAALALILVFLAGATAAVAFYPRGGGVAAAAVPEQGQAASADRTSEFVRWWDAQTRTQLPVSSDGAAVVFVRFSDFQCPSCAVTYREYKTILARFAAQYPGAIKVVQKEFPLETECNTALARDLHTASCEAAAASKAAHAKGRGEAMDDWLYANGATLTPASVRQAAGEVGGITDFDAQYRALINTVKGDIALATILGVKVTPTFYINGVKLEGALPPQYMELALQLELKKAGKSQ